MKLSCLPDYIIESARILGEEMSCMEDLESNSKQFLCTPVDPYMQEPALSLTSDAPAIKALAMMEQNDTSYLFVVDDGQYQGAVTIQCLAKMLTRLDQC
jgi:CBS domain-containing protein